MLKEIKSLCFSFGTKRKNGTRPGSEKGQGLFITNRIQELISQGEYNGLSPLVRAEGAFVQYNADGSYYRRVGLGITHHELLIVSQILKTERDDEETELKIELVFPLPTLHFFLLDNKAKRFAVCTCVGVLFFFEMCDDEPGSAVNWDKWRRVIFLQTIKELQGSPWQTVWTSPYVLNLSEKNNMPAFKFLESSRGKAVKRKLYFIHHPFPLKLVRSVGIQTDDPLERRKTSLPTPKPMTIQELSRSVAQPPEDIYKEGQGKIARKLQDMRADSARRMSLAGRNSNAGVATEINFKEIQRTYDPESGRIPKASNKLVRVKGTKKTGKRRHNTNTVWKKSKSGYSDDIDSVLYESETDRKFRTAPDQRLPLFDGGYRLLKQFKYSFDQPVYPRGRRKAHGRPIRRSCSCDDLVLTGNPQNFSKFDKLVIYSWNPNTSCSKLDASDLHLAKKYKKFTQKMQEQSDKRPLSRSSPTVDIEDIDDLVEEFSEKKQSEEENRRTGRDLWLIARKKLKGRDQVVLEQLQNLVSTYVFKLTPHRSSEKGRDLTDFTPLAVSLELFSVSRKLFLSLTAADIIAFRNKQQKQTTRGLSAILEFSDDITNLVVSKILSFKGLFDRIDAIKFFIEVCQNLLMTHQDFQTFTAIMRALMSLPIYRLQNTWATFYMEYPFHFSYIVCMGKVLSPEGGFGSYISRIDMALSKTAPCIPWIEHFLMHCTRKPYDERTHVQTLMSKRNLSELKTTPKKDKRKISQEPKGASLVTQEVDQQVRPILHDYQFRQFSNLSKHPKIVTFSSKVDVVDRGSSIFGVTGTPKVPSGTPVDEIQTIPTELDQDSDDLDVFCEETATNILDRAIDDIREDLEDSARIKFTEDLKNNILYQKVAKFASGSDFVANEQKTEGNTPKEVSNLNTSKEKENKASNIRQKHQDRKTENKNKEKEKEKEEKRNRGKKDPEKTRNPIIQKLLRSSKENKSDKKNEIMTATLQKDRMLPSMKQTSIATKERRSLTRKASNEVKSPMEKYMTLTVGPKPKEYEKEAESQPGRKRKMSKMDIKKQNRRLSLFEQAEMRRDGRMENKLNEEVSRRMADMRRHGSIAIDLLQPDIVKTSSNNNDFQYLLTENRDEHENYNDTGSNKNRERKPVTYRTAPDYKSNVKVLVDRFSMPHRTDSSNYRISQETNNNNIGKVENVHDRAGKLRAECIYPCRSWSGCLLDSEIPKSKKHCRLCRNNDCIYISGIWHTFIKFQMNLLKSDVHSSETISNCLKDLVFASSRLSEYDLIKMSHSIEN